MNQPPRGVSHQEDNAPDAFKEQEARLQRALQGSKNRDDAEQEAEEPDEVEELGSLLNPDEEAQAPKDPSPPPRPSKPVKKRKQVTIDTGDLKITFPVNEVTMDPENSAISLFLADDTDVVPKMQGEFKLTTKGQTFEVVFAGSRVNVPAAGGLIVSFVARKLEDD